jgi:hypothetical protein
MVFLNGTPANQSSGDDDLAIAMKGKMMLHYFVTIELATIIVAFL